MIIWKHKLEKKQMWRILMAPGSTVLYAGEQNGDIFIWAQHPVAEFFGAKTPPDRAPDLDIRAFSTYGTGEPMPPDPGTFIGTVQMENGLVWHVYEDRP